jgi:hypothetical protein
MFLLRQTHGVDENPTPEKGEVCLEAGVTYNLRREFRGQGNFLVTAQPGESDL